MFSGVGGVTLGFMQAGFNVAWSNEFDSHACDTYRTNFPTHNLIEGDIREVSPEKAGYVDVITSGFPCQAFSIAGNRKGFEDPRGNLFFETARFIDTLRPKAYLFENVKNLKTHDNGNTLKTIKNVLTEDLGYTCETFILKAYAHGNIPQGRERIYIVGFREDVHDLFKSPHSFEESIPTQKLDVLLRDLIDKEQQDAKYYFPKDHKYMPKLEEVMVSKHLMYQWRRKYVRTNMKELCPTLTANMGSGGHNVPLLVDDYGFRRLTPRECFRFQGFPESFKFPDKMADSHLYKQAGNSVTVPVIKIIADYLKKVLDS